MLSEATAGELMRFIPMHPSIGEAMVDAAMDVEKRSLHTCPSGSKIVSVQTSEVLAVIWLGK